MTQKHEKELYQLGFQEKEDHIFVGAAMNADKILVTEDSDYGVHGEKDYQKVYTYMKDNMGLLVLESNQFYNQFQ